MDRSGTASVPMTTDLSGEISFRVLPEALLYVQWPEGRIRACNPAAEALTGYGREELTGSSLEVLVADEERTEAFRRPCRMALGRGQPARISYPVRRADGEMRPTEHVLAPLEGSPGGDFETVLLLMRNVNEEEARWSQLKRLRVDALKIDRTFVDGLPADDQDRAIVEGVLTLGHALGLTVVAEGVASADQMEVLRDLGVDEAQGLYLARPMSMEDLWAWMEARS